MVRTSAPRYVHACLRVHVRWTTWATMTYERCVSMYVWWVGAGRGGVGRMWLVASGTACALRLLGLWSFHLLCAAILMSVRYTNRQIKHTACGHAWESIPWRGAWWGALPLAWSCASLPPRFVAGLGDDVAAVRPMRVNPVCCGAWTCEVREVDLARWFSWGVHVIIIIK